MAWISKTPCGEHILSESRWGVGASSYVMVETRTGNVREYSPDLVPGEGEFVHLVKAAREHVAQ